MALVGVFAAAALLAPGPALNACEALVGHRLATGQVVLAKIVAASDAAPASCRVTARLSSGRRSRIGLQLWLPLTGWSGRYVQLGTGGFAGTIPEAGLAAELRRGNAAAATDTGHQGVDGFDAAWALRAPRKILDYGHLSLKISAAAAQDLTAAFYGLAPRYRYFVGCSNGGRQAMMAAQRYPALWDGVLAGAPALRWTGQLSSLAWTQHALRTLPGGVLSQGKLELVQAAARAGCGPQAGLVDGAPTDPRACRFEPKALQCQERGAGPCLTPDEVAALTAIVEGARDPRSSAPLAFGFEPTFAAAPGGWGRWIVNPDRGAQTQVTLAEQFFGQMVLGRPGWRVEDLRWPQDLARTAALAPVLDAASADLSAFARRGGKLMIYAGWADPVISPSSAVDYYQRLGAPDFARLYLIPGMLHCQGGTSPAAFGQAPAAPAARD
ncbi:MAG: Tannase and feruloyl esterase, partial [Caulobacter sp.]|nr:Tannase and feruloyl esterase [Caulobacter sp.]